MKWKSLYYVLVLLIADIERITLLILKLNINHLMQCNYNFGFSVKKVKYFKSFFHV